MNKLIKPLFLAHSVVALLVGVPLLGAPGRFLGALGWAPVDPLLSRVLGAALIGLAWGGWRAFRSSSPAVLRTLVEVEAVFCWLAVAGLARNMWGTRWPWMVWLLLGTFAVFGVGWVLAWLKQGQVQE